MLTELQIENIAVIERADIEPVPGLNVLTGETGAGKSIVIDALDAVLGGRTSRELVRTGAEKATVSAVFTADGVSDWFAENDIDLEESVIVRRRVSADGRSSATVNGVPVTISHLRTLGSRLLDIHGQNDGRQLMDESRHRDYLDGFAGLAEELEAYRKCYDGYCSVLKELEAHNLGEDEKRRLEDGLRYRIGELEAADLKAGEQDELNTRRDLLRNAEKLTEAVDAAYGALYGSDGSAAEQTGDAAEYTDRAAAFAPELQPVSGQIGEARGLIEDAAERLRDFRDKLDFTPGEYDALETRLGQLRRLEKKYNADEEGLIALLEDARRELEKLEYSGERRAALEAELYSCREQTRAAAEILSGRRKKAAKILQKRIEEGLRELNMPSVRFETEILPIGGDPGFGASGGDEVRFLMSANAGEPPGRISRIASGGELSRIMLVMKDVLSERDGVQTMVFDEIDEGVSGVAAQRVGEKLCRLSGTKQVICVTHLPQIAAMADGHFHIEKSERNGRTYTDVSLLDGEGRAAELARLHGGENITITTLASAREQLEAAVKYKGNCREGLPK